ncbi:MAG TPA: SCO family protein [Longimicrobium sp.]|jgi:protein SCO1/2
MAKGKRRPYLWAAALGCAALVAGCDVRWPGAAAFHGTTYEDTGPAPDFALTDHTEREVTLASFRGHPVLLFFGYTHCPDICPLTLARLQRSVRALGSRGEDVRILLVTNDPARDTPPVLRAYASRFGPQVVGLTGDSASVARAMAGYGAYTLPPGAGAHTGHAPAAPEIAHSAVVYGIDRQGRLQVVISEGTKQEWMDDDVRTLARL